jgi:hypothetical protein
MAVLRGGVCMKRLVLLAASLLLPAVAGAATAATPTFSPVAGTYSSNQNVAVTSATPGARIYYTTNGTTPTTSSTLYSSPITVSATTTVKALAAATGYTTSAVASATYTLVAATPTFSPAAGTYGANQTVTISSATPGAKIYYMSLPRSRGHLRCGGDWVHGQETEADVQG